MNLPRDTEEKPPRERLVFGQNFRKARKAAKLTQRDITDKAGYAQSFISEVETGRCAINIDNMAALAKVVNIPLWKLLVP
ncbi:MULTISPECIES: helix-turn-helix domain-containing protein [Enterobacterales]|uniref:helix-turn-helix domain-containing protein n=1 Tax=Enterobacterales TaxID=91347 RepID=UPI000DA43D1A|nr:MULTISPECIES: helix-turn-helix transcriptional regulator [Enterobacterales]SQY61137.1 transcriptional regulator [Escherichia coli]